MMILNIFICLFLGHLREFIILFVNNCDWFLASVAQQTALFILQSIKLFLSQFLWAHHQLQCLIIDWGGLVHHRFTTLFRWLIWPWSSILNLHEWSQSHLLLLVWLGIILLITSLIIVGKWIERLSGVFGVNICDSLLGWVKSIGVKCQLWTKLIELSHWSLTQRCDYGSLLLDLLATTAIHLNTRTW